MAALKLTDSFRFGKYIGKSVRDVAVNVPDYIRFFLGKNPTMFDDEVLAVIEEPNKLKRVEIAKELMGNVKSEDELYADMPFPPMCNPDEIPF